MDSDTDPTPRGASTRQVEQLALLTLAIGLGAIGFAISIAWIAAIVVLAAAWGYQAAALRASRADGGVVSALVSTAVHEARSIAADATAAVHDVGPPETTETTETGDQTKGELYKQAQDADIAGRSSMSKDELKQALEGE